MRKLLICSLLAFMPLTGVRVVCVEGSGGARTASAVDGGDPCDEFCPRRTSPAEGVPASNVDCMLLADGVLLLVFSGTALVPVLPGVPFEPLSVALVQERQDFYLAPVLAHYSPPPWA